MRPIYFKNINIGITAQCNAKCAYCNRQTLPDFPDMNTRMRFKTFNKILGYSEHIQFCGSFGDFSMHAHGLAIAQLAKARGALTIETNGAKKDSRYWEELGRICNSEKHKVQFNVDDVENVINPYRQVKTEDVLDNIMIFTRAGGYAVSKTILFKFNEDQPIREHLKDVGVKEFYTQYSTIYEPGTFLEAPTNFPHVTGTLPFIYNTSKLMSSSLKSCPWQDMEACYILDNGEVHVCCNLIPWAAHIQDLMPGVGQYTHYSRYGKELELYEKNKHKINLNMESVTLDSAWNNEYNVYVRENFQGIQKCQERCLIQNITPNPIDGMKRAD